MSELASKKTKTRKGAEAVPVETGPIEIEGLEDFTSAEIARLLNVKQAIAQGRFTDITPEHRKLQFVQWLLEHGKLSS
jgi:hypothetical protein